MQQNVVHINVLIQVYYNITTDLSDTCINPKRISTGNPN